MKTNKILIGFGILFALFIFILLLFSIIGLFSGSKKSSMAFGSKIAIVEIKGEITESSDIIEELHEYTEDDGIKAIILRIDSPGGGVVPSQEIYSEILKIRPKKKVITSMGSVAASGGYYIASASDLIVANPGTLTGSIGVIMQYQTFEELLKKIGVKGVVMKSGEMKDIGSPFREMTPDEKQVMQEVLDNVHQQFIQAISDGRKMDRSKVVELANGRIYTGEQAKALGLVDQMGNLQDAIELTAKMVGIAGKPNVIYPKKKTSIMELLMKEMASAVVDVLNEKGYEFNSSIKMK